MATDHLRGSGTYDSSLFCSLFLNSSVKELLNWCTFNNNINGIFLSNGIFQSKRSGHPKHSVKSTKINREVGQDGQWSPQGEPRTWTRDPTTSFLTATTLIYAIGAGITVAAGTRLALQWILVKGFKVYSFPLPGLEWVPYCYFSSLPPRFGSG